MLPLMLTLKMMFALMFTLMFTWVQRGSGRSVRVLDGVDGLSLSAFCSPYAQQASETCKQTADRAPVQERRSIILAFSILVRL